MTGHGKSVDFVFGLTYEKEGTEKLNYKFRCLIIRQDELEAIGEERRNGNEHWYKDVDLEVPRGSKAEEYFRHRLRNLELLSVLYEDFRNSSNPDHVTLCEDSKCAMIGSIKLLDRGMVGL